MTTMLEKMALAMLEVVEYEGDDGMADSQGVARVSNWPEVARAALQAIREPSDEMLRGATNLPDADAYEAWIKIVDAILAGEA